MAQPTPHLAAILKNDPGVDGGYRHFPKWVTPGDLCEPPGLVLKWYALHLRDQPVPAAVTELARSYLMKNVLEARGLGFVILHRCGNDFYFLIVSTWRNANELWETVFYKNGEAMADFAPFPRDGIHKPAFCVWELAPVQHEQLAWARFLQTSRDEAAAQTWSTDVYTGVA